MHSMLRIGVVAFLAVVVNFVTVAFFFGNLASSQCASTSAPGPGPAACFNGDVNGDQGLNLGDVVYLLNHIFNSGPAPVALAQGAGDTNLQATLGSVITISSGTQGVPFDTVSSDDLGEFNTTTGEFVAQTSGVYLVKSSVLYRWSGVPSRFSVAIQATVGGVVTPLDARTANSSVTGGTGYVSSSALSVVELQPGDQVRVLLGGPPSASLVITPAETNFTVTRLRDI